MKVCFLIFGVLIRSMKEAVLDPALSSARVYTTKDNSSVPSQL